MPAVLTLDAESHAAAAAATAATPTFMRVRGLEPTTTWNESAMDDGLR